MQEVPRGVRRQLRMGLGSRVVRRMGTKSRVVPTGRNRNREKPQMPRTRLKAAIKLWHQEQAHGV